MRFSGIFRAPFEPCSENSHKWVAKWTPMSQSWHSGQSGASVNGPKWFPTPKHIGPFTQIKSLASPGAKIEIYTLKGSWTSYSRYIPFLGFRSIKGFWKQSQMIPHTKKHGVRHQNQVSRRLRRILKFFAIFSWRTIFKWPKMGEKSRKSKK